MYIMHGTVHILAKSFKRAAILVNNWLTDLNENNVIVYFVLNKYIYL